jgi:hypothetical protein
VIALALAHDGSLFVSDPEPTGYQARDLVAGGKPIVIRRTVCLPCEIEVQIDRLSAETLVDGLRRAMDLSDAASRNPKLLQGLRRIAANVDALRRQMEVTIGQTGKGVVRPPRERSIRSHYHCGPPCDAQIWVDTKAYIAP